MSTRHIGLVFHHSLTVNRDTIRGIRDYALENPNWVLTPVFPAAKQLDSAKTRACDGLICHLFNEEVHQAAARMKKPVVNISGTVTFGFPRVTVDHMEVGRMAAQHLVEKGFRRFGFVGYRGYEFSLQREKGFREFLEERGNHVVHYHEARTFKKAPSGFEPCTKALRFWIRRVEKPIAILAAHDIQGLQISEACQEEGIQIPEQLALISVDNDDLLCAMCRPPLSSIELPTRKVGYEAAALLDRLMKGGKRPQNPLVLPPTRVIARQSSDMSAVPSTDVSRAIQYIRENFNRPIQAADVLGKVPVSRRTLERNFRFFIGRSIGEELKRMRLSLAEQLLIDTDLSVGEIAERSGFTEHKYLSTGFIRAKGVTPSQFRKQHRATSRSC